MKNYIQNPNQKVVITFDKQTTLARIYENNKVIAKGSATCSPEDEFDLAFGSKLAIERAVESMTLKKVEQKWNVVKRKAKVGDYIRLTTKVYEFDEIGDIHRVHKVNTEGEPGVLIKEHTGCKEWIETHFHGWFNDCWYYADCEFEIVEPVEDGVEIINGERFRKVDRKPKPGDYMKIIESGFPCENKGDVYKISKVEDSRKHYNICVRHGDHPAHMKLFGVNEWYHKDYIWNHWSDNSKFEILEKL